MKVQVIVTEDNGHVIEHEGDAIIFCLRQREECTDVCGVAGFLSINDLRRMTSTLIATVAKSILEDSFNIAGSNLL